MKKIFQQLIVLTATTVLLSSCGNLSKMSITKRHYRNGYFLDFASNKHISPINKVAIEPKDQALPVMIAKPTEQVVSNTPIVSTEKLNAVVKRVATKRNKASIAKAITANSTPLATITTLTAGLDTYNSDESVSDHHAQVNANVSFALIVVCAIFIPPLGVALMYGIDSYFWIDLILTLLFFFPGMIFALIVVLT